MYHVNIIFYITDVPTSIATSNVQVPKHATNNVQDVSSPALNSLTTVNNDIYGGTSVIRTTGTFKIPSVSSAASTSQYNIVFSQFGSNYNMTPILDEYSNNPQSNINQVNNVVKDETDEILFEPI